MTNLVSRARAERYGGQNQGRPSRTGCDTQRQVLGELRVEDGIRTRRQVGTMLFQYSARHDDNRLRAVKICKVSRIQISEMQGLGRRLLCAEKQEQEHPWFSHALEYVTVAEARAAIELLAAPSNLLRIPNVGSNVFEKPFVRRPCCYVIFKAADSRIVQPLL